MRHNDEFIGQLEDYLVEFDGVTPLPDRVMDAIHVELPRIRQARARPGLMRMPPMISTISSRAPLWVAAAAVVVAVAIGAAVVNRGNEQTGVAVAPVARPTPGPSLGPTQTPNPTVTNLPNAALDLCRGSGSPECIKPGTYQLGSTPLWPAAVSLEVPASWRYYVDGPGHAGVLVDRHQDAPKGSGWGITFSTIGSVSVDPCNEAAGMFDVGKDTPGELADVMASSWPGFEVTEPEPIKNGEYNGVSLTLTSTMSSAECPSPVFWTTRNSFPVDAYPLVNDAGRAHTTEFRIFGIDGELLVIKSMNFPETSPYEEENGIPVDPVRHADDQVEMAAILDSIQLSAPPQP